MPMTVVGIAANEALDAGDKLHHLAISYTPQGYVKGVQAAGGLPMVLPIAEPEYAKEYIARIDKLILAGGQDVSPHYYHKTQVTPGNYLQTRDRFEMALLEEALKQDKPVFAVCRGMQLMNVYFGGTLKQELADFSDVDHMQKLPQHVPSHTVLTNQTSALHTIYGTKGYVNSFHHQGVDELARTLNVGATCPDGLIEAIEAPKQRLLGVQWHPDFAYQTQKEEQAIFDYVVHNL
jgi:Predicted glutamine amidotransferases